METYNPKTRSTRIFVQELPHELVVYDVERNEVHCLNGTAARVWELCNGTNTVADIARLLGTDLEPQAAETLVWVALDQFAEKHLLEEVADSSPDLYRPTDMTRRQMVLRVGLVVALLPMVDSIIAPPAALAASPARGCTPQPTGMGPGGCTTD
jgi:hypothetical protein